MPYANLVVAPRMTAPVFQDPGDPLLSGIEHLTESLYAAPQQAAQIRLAQNEQADRQQQEAEHNFDLNRQFSLNQDANQRATDQQLWGWQNDEERMAETQRANKENERLRAVSEGNRANENFLRGLNTTAHQTAGDMNAFSRIGVARQNADANTERADTYAKRATKPTHQRTLSIEADPTGQKYWLDKATGDSELWQPGVRPHLLDQPTEPGPTVDFSQVLQQNRADQQHLVDLYDQQHPGPMQFAPPVPNAPQAATSVAFAGDPRPAIMQHLEMRIGAESDPDKLDKLQMILDGVKKNDPDAISGAADMLKRIAASSAANSADAASQTKISGATMSFGP